MLTCLFVITNQHFGCVMGISGFYVGTFPILWFGICGLSFLFEFCTPVALPYASTACASTRRIQSIFGMDQFQLTEVGGLVWWREKLTKCYTNPDSFRLILSKSDNYKKLLKLESGNVLLHAFTYN